MNYLLILCVATLTAAGCCHRALPERRSQPAVAFSVRVLKADVHDPGTPRDMEFLVEVDTLRVYMNRGRSVDVIQYMYGTKHALIEQDSKELAYGRVVYGLFLRLTISKYDENSAEGEINIEFVQGGEDDIVVIKKDKMPFRIGTSFRVASGQGD